MMKENSEGESKVVYRDGNEIRALRGRVVDLDDQFIRVKMESELKGPDVVIQDVLSVGVNLLFALQNKGKTWMALQIARCITSGDDFLGKKIPNKGKVI